MKTKDKKWTRVRIIALVLICVILIFGYFYLCKLIVLSIFEKKMEGKLLEVKTTYELNDLSYAMSDQIESEWYNGELRLTPSITVSCSEEFSDFEPSKQYKIIKGISSAVYSAGRTSDGGGVSLLASCHKLGCGEDEYEIDSYKGILEKNSEEIYIDPEDHARYERNTNNSGSLSSYSSVSASDDDYWYAVTAAQELVKERLKSPSTAKFPLDSYSVSRSGNNWKVSGYVDAQNGFGAISRSNWTVTFAMGDTNGSKYKVSNYEVTFN